MNYILLAGIFACLACIPASMAEKKGHSFLGWWIYGFVLFFLAMLHVQFIVDYRDDDYFDEKVLRAADRHRRHSSRRHKSAKSATPPPEK